MLLSMFIRARTSKPEDFSGNPTYMCIFGNPISGEATDGGRTKGQEDDRKADMRKGNLRE
jgi:hypothetical protein